MSFEEAASKLQPFGIRELYGSKTGVLHISKPQYDSTITSYPDAVLRYVDDDDGEVITVGSGLELQQRLDEPVRLGRRRRHAAQASSSRRGSMDDSMIHLFDIQRTQDNLVIWQEHEAYSSKSLRSSCSSSAVSDVEADATLPRHFPDTTESVSPPTNTQPPLIQEETAAEDHVTIQQPAEAQTQAVAENVPRSVSTNCMQDLDNVLLAACNGLEAFGLADILDGTAQALKSLAQTTRDADTTPVEGLLKGFKDIVTEFGKFGLDVLESMDTSATAATQEPERTAARDTDNSSCKCAQKAATKREREQDRQDRKETRLAVKEQRREEKRARRVERLTQREERRASKKGKAPVMSDFAAANGSNSIPPSPEASEPQKCVSFADLQDEIRQEFGNQETVLKATKTETVERPTITAMPPTFADVEAHQVAPTFSGHSMPYRNFPNKAVPAISSSTPYGRPSTGPVSIMDLETSNADFTARYPPLMSLRRAKTVSELHRKMDPATANDSVTTTKTALSRYPSIGQLEARRRAGEDPRRSQVAAMQADMLRRREKQKAESVSSYTHRAPFVEDDIEGSVRPAPLFDGFDKDLSSSVAKPLPGSWPEPRSEEAPPRRSNESSGAFFNRMTMETSPILPRAISPALSCRTTSPPEDPYFPQNGLRRAQTVTASNPAARLSSPWDPLSNGPRLEPVRKAPTLNDTLPQRSFTMQHRRRHHPEPTISTVGGQHTLWSNFPRQAQVPVTQGPQPPAVPQVRPPHYPRPIWPNGGITSASVDPPHRLPRPMRSEPNFHYPAPNPTRGGCNGYFPPPPSSTNKVDECVKTLRAMGYGLNSPNEAARLNVYAGAAAGDVQDAIDMIEEDRQAGEAISAGKIRVL